MQTDRASKAGVVFELTTILSQFSHSHLTLVHMISLASITLISLSLAGATVRAGPSPVSPKGLVVPLSMKPEHVARLAKPTADLEWLKSTKVNIARYSRFLSPSLRSSRAYTHLSQQQVRKRSPQAACWWRILDGLPFIRALDWTHHHRWPKVVCARFRLQCCLAIR